MSKVRCFISFDYDHDLDLKNLLVGQSKNDDSPFEISDWSIKEASDEWESEARDRVRHSDQVIAICGHHTDTAVGVSKELKIVQAEDKPYFLLAGRSEGNNKKPASAKSSDKIYKWTWDNLKKLIDGKR